MSKGNENSSKENRFKKIISRLVNTFNQVASQQQLINEQKIMLDYFYYEISDLRSKVRYLMANSDVKLPSIVQTKESFNYQWNKLNFGKNLLSDDDFVSNLKEIILNNTNLPESWFRGKKILDAGCGQGRFSYGLALLGAEVIAIDQSEYAIKSTKEALSNTSSPFQVIQHSLLKEIPLERDFDLVWSFGVLHHTGNTYKAFQNITELVKPDGYLFLMLYGEPPLGNLASFQEQTEYNRLRNLTKNLTYEEKIKLIVDEKSEENLHGWFDAVSPMVNDTYSFEEIKTWLLSSGFKNIKITSPSTNLHIICQKEGELNSIEKDKLQSNEILQTV